MRGRAFLVAATLAVVPAGVAAAQTPPSTVTINWVGDTNLGSRAGLPPDHGRGMFRGVEPQLSSADLTVGNLEGTFSAGGPSKCGGGHVQNCFAFQAPPANAAALRGAGFDLMNLANNHAFDFGAGGEQQTIAALDRVGIAHTGLPGRVTVVRVHGIRIAFVGFAPYAWASDLRDIPAARRLVSGARKRADVIVVVIHAGAEGANQIHTPHGREVAFGEDRGRTRAFAHAVVDAGADLVVGSGPHVIRGLERYRNRVIAYSLGNFASWHAFGLGGTLSLSGILHVTLDATGHLVNGQWLSVKLVPPGLPHRDFADTSARLMERLSRDDFPHTFSFGEHGAFRSAAPAR